MIDTNSKCFFNKNHDHIGQPKIINRDLLNIINEYDKKKSIVEPNPVINQIEFQIDKFIYKGKLIGDKPIGLGEIIYKDIGIFKGNLMVNFIKVKEKFFMRIIQNMKENGKILKDRIMEFFIIIILIDMRENLKMICMKEKVNYFYLKEIFVMKDSGEKGKNLENSKFIMNLMN